MPILLNLSEAHICLPVMGKGTKQVVKQKAVEGVLVEEVVEETYDKVVDTLVIPPSLFQSDPQQIEVSKSQLKELQKIPYFESATKPNGQVRVID